MSTKSKTARDLVVGDFLNTAIGYAPITAIKQDHGGLAIHLDIDNIRSTRPRSETSVLWVYLGERVAFRSGDSPPPLNAERVEARREGVTTLRRSTGRRPGVTA
jgi:hypothetical protein